MATSYKAPPALRRILASTIDAIDELTLGISSGLLQPVDWHNEVANVLLVSYTAAAMRGQGVRTLDAASEAEVARLVGEQVEYLNAFLDEVEDRGWLPSDASRARMYARSVASAYYRGTTNGLELPAYPGDGSTECLTNCQCEWRIRWLDRENLDADCFWRLGSAEHCETCQRRARQWNPLRVREGMPL